MAGSGGFETIPWISTFREVLASREKRRSLYAVLYMKISISSAPGGVVCSAISAGARQRKYIYFEFPSDSGVISRRETGILQAP
jgi:hypothetical protein